MGAFSVSGSFVRLPGELALAVLDTFNVLKYRGPAFQIAAWDTQLFYRRWPACAAKLLHFTLEY